MPVLHSNKKRYPHNWKALSYHIKFVRAGGRCECDGRCKERHVGRCPERHGAPSVFNGKPIVLTTAHLDHTPEHNDDANLMAMCAPCHLAYDRPHHIASRKARIARRTAC